MNWLLSVYIGATIFGVGVTIADLFGAFSNLVGGESGDGGDTESDGDDFDDAEADDAAGDEGPAEHQGSIVGHDRSYRGSAVLKVMTGVRSLVYFALGFGPVGWFATTQYASRASTLAWSLPIGLVVMVGTRLLRSFMRKDLSSDIKEEDLIMEKGTVTVSIGKGQLGKVRTSIGGVYVERFARARNGESVFSVGTAVRIVDVADDCVYVEVE